MNSLEEQSILYVFYLPHSSESVCLQKQFRDSALCDVTQEMPQKRTEVVLEVLIVLLLH